MQTAELGRQVLRNCRSQDHPSPVSRASSVPRVPSLGLTQLCLPRGSGPVGPPSQVVTLSQARGLQPQALDYPPPPWGLTAGLSPPQGQQLFAEWPPAPPSSSPEARPPPDPRSRPPPGGDAGHTAQWAASCPAPCPPGLSHGPPWPRGLLGLSLSCPPPTPQASGLCLASSRPRGGGSSHTLEWGGEGREVVRGRRRRRAQMEVERKRPSRSPSASRISKTESSAGRGNARVHCSRGPCSPDQQISGTKTLLRGLRRSPPPASTLPLLPLGGGPALGLSSPCLRALLVSTTGRRGRAGGPQGWTCGSRRWPSSRPRAWTTLLLACGGCQGPPGGPQPPRAPSSHGQVAPSRPCSLSSPWPPFAGPRP